MIERTAEKPHSSAIVLTIRNDLNELKRVPERLLGFFRSHDVSTGAAYRGRVAVEELVVNVIRYGYDDVNVHTIEIEVRIEDEMLVVRVEDDGRSFDPRGMPRPDLTAAVETRSAGGWGIHLVRSLCSEFLYERRRNHNVVRVRIPLTARKG